MPFPAPNNFLKLRQIVGCTIDCIFQFVSGLVMPVIGKPATANIQTFDRSLRQPFKRATPCQHGFIELPPLPHSDVAAGQVKMNSKDVLAGKSLYHVYQFHKLFGSLEGNTEARACSGRTKSRSYDFCL